MPQKLERLMLLFEQLEMWDTNARQPIVKAVASLELTTPQSSDTPLERNMQSYQALTTEIREIADAADDEVLEYLISRLHHKNTMVRLQAIAALGYTGHIGAIEPLAAILRQDTYDDVKAAAAQSLGFFGSRSATIPLIEFLQSEMLHRGEAKVRFACAQALSFIADPAAVDPLLDTLTRNYDVFESDVSDLREAVRDALVSIGTETVVEKFIELWSKPQIHPLTAVDETIRNEIITAFGQIERPKAFDFLLTLAHHDRSDVREMVMSALSYHGDDRAVQTLSDALEDIDPSVRDAAEFSLQRLGKSPDET